MPVSVDWSTGVISIPRSYLDDLGGGVYELDVERLRLDLKDAEDGEQGIVHPDTHRRNEPVTIAGVTYAQTLEIVNDYEIEFEDGQYAVNIVGANSNVAEVARVNQVSIRSFNSAGLIVSGSGGGGGGGPSAAQIAARVWEEPLDGHDGPGTAGKALDDALRNTDILAAGADAP